MLSTFVSTFLESGTLPVLPLDHPALTHTPLPPLHFTTFSAIGLTLSSTNTFTCQLTHSSYNPLGLDHPALTNTPLPTSHYTAITALQILHSLTLPSTTTLACLDSHSPNSPQTTQHSLILPSLTQYHIHCLITLCKYQIFLPKYLTCSSTLPLHSLELNLLLCTP